MNTINLGTDDLIDETDINPDADLSGADLQELDLSGAEFAGAISGCRPYRSLSTMSN